MTVLWKVKKKENFSKYIDAGLNKYMSILSDFFIYVVDANATWVFIYSFLTLVRQVTGLGVILASVFKSNFNPVILLEL